MAQRSFLLLRVSLNTNRVEEAAQQIAESIVADSPIASACVSVVSMTIYGTSAPRAPDSITNNRQA